MPGAVIIGFVRPRSVYEAGFSGTVSVPDGVTSFQAWVQGAGGAGRTLSGLDYGGGGGGYVYFYSDVLETEWGTSLTLTVGSAVDDAAGEASIVTGTLNGAAFTLTANGGKRAELGGTASGGTTNIDGYEGIPADVETSTNGNWGLEGGTEQELTEVGGRGGLGSSSVVPAQDGYIAIEWG